MTTLLRDRARLFAVAAACALAAAWIVNLSLTPALVVDDATVFLRYAQNWVDLGWLSWNAGETGTDGFTSFSHQVLVAAAYFVHRSDVMEAGWYVCFFASVAVIVVQAGHAYRLWERKKRSGLVFAAGVAGVATTALSPQLAYWTQTILDTATWTLAVTCASLGTAHLLASPVVVRRDRIAAAVAIAAFGVTRPEAMAIVAFVCALVVVRAARARRSDHPEITKPLLVMAAIPACVVGVYFVWHRVRYGYAFPNPVYVKTLGFRTSALQKGYEYLTTGPTGGHLPVGLTRLTDAQHVPPRTVKAAINAAPAWLHAIPALTLGFTFAVALAPSLWRTRADCQRVRALLILPMAILATVVVAGGDAFHTAWRMVVPLLPAVAIAGVQTAAGLRSAPLRRAVAGALGVHAFALLAGLFGRPDLCTPAATYCGYQAVRSWPVSKDTYSWDITSAYQDRQLWTALVESGFPTDASFGQSDFLRIGLYHRGRVVDFSGLVTAELAHAPRPEGKSLFELSLATPEAVEWWHRTAPDVVVWGWGLLSYQPAANHAAVSPELASIFRPWPPPARSNAEARRLFALLANYVTASVRVKGGQYFNMLLHRRALARMHPSARLLVGPVSSAPGAW